jgi:hypothetical protein
VSELRLNFLNWRPDSEDTDNDGLTVADNMIHESEGYKPVHLGSAGSFATTGGLAASNATVLALIAKPVGSQGDVITAWVSSKATPTLHIGINGVTESGATTGYPLSFSTAYTDSTTSPLAIYAFDACEYAGKIFFTVDARMGESSPSTTQTLRFSAYMNF